MKGKHDGSVKTPELDEQRKHVFERLAFIEETMNWNDMTRRWQAARCTL